MQSRYAFPTYSTMLSARRMDRRSTGWCARESHAYLMTRNGTCRRPYLLACRPVRGQYATLRTGLFVTWIASVLNAWNGKVVLRVAIADVLHHAAKSLEVGGNFAGFHPAADQSA